MMSSRSRSETTTKVIADITISLHGSSLVRMRATGRPGRRRYASTQLGFHGHEAVLANAKQRNGAV
jgi:hypothetical protein